MRTLYSANYNRRCGERYPCLRLAAARAGAYRASHQQHKSAGSRFGRPKSARRLCVSEGAQQKSDRSSAAVAQAGSIISAIYGKCRLIASIIALGWVVAGCSMLEPSTASGICPEPACADWEFLPFSHQGTPLVGFRKPGVANSGRQVVYIEGDGKGWRSRSRLSKDPTPAAPVGLRLALQDSRPGLIYLARPCQYVRPELLERCQPSLWSSARYSEHVVEAMNRAVTAAKHAQSDRLTLVGYSGGGVIATLLASRRSDVDRLVTVAAPLDTKIWVEHHRVSPLTESLNPRTSATAGSAREFHFHGKRDQIVPPEVIKPYIRQAARAGVRFFTLAEYDHNCCWVRDWPALLAMAEG